MIPENDLRQIASKIIPDSHFRPLYIEKISKWIDTKEVLIIKGIRRSGKTHIMYQLMKNLPKENTFYFNFEDFYFEGERDVNLLEAIVKLRDPKKRSYFFFDEIQKIEGFERWLRTYYDKELPIKFIIGGSNISLLTPDLATVLTGRNKTFVVKPLTWKEAKDFAKVSFSDYLEYGGFPEVLLEKNKDIKKERLQQYVGDIIAKDILFKHKAENPKLLESLVYFFLKNPGVKISENKLGSQLGISKETASKYLLAVMETFMLFEVPFYSQSAKTKYIGNRASKYYIVDNGFITAVARKKNLSYLYENVVAINLFSDGLGESLYYWQNGVEIDFIKENFAIQVTATNNIPDREIKAFEVFSEKHKHFKHILVCAKDSDLGVDLQSYLEK